MRRIWIGAVLLLMMLLSLGCQNSDETAFSPILDRVETESAMAIMAAPPGPPDTAEVQFGNSHANDPANRTAKNKMVPGEVVISVGGTVKFVVNGFHQVAVYKPGVNPGDITPSDGHVDDPTNRYFLGELQTDAEVTFNEPGRYLVICNITSHFLDNMIGWVTVIGINEP